MDDSETIEQLNKLKEWAYQLASDPSLIEDFELWYKEAINTIRNIFGDNSREMMEFNQINFKIDSDIVQSVKCATETIKHQLENISQKDNEIQYFDTSLVHYYRERLYEAIELILAMILKQERL